MQAVPSAFDTKLLSHMTAAADAAAAARGEGRSPLELLLVALAVIEVKPASVPAYRPCSLPIAHRCSA
jgi:hypothetical protein